MLLILFIVISFGGSAFVSHLEQKRGLPAARIRLMGQWPYNFILVVGVAVFILTNGKPFEATAGVVVLIATTAFYAVTLYRLSKA